MMFFKQEEVLIIIGREDSTTLWSWVKKNWFPPANFRGRPPRWTDTTLEAWINEGIPKMLEGGARIPELASEVAALAYQSACRDRLKQMKEKRERIRSIRRVYRTIVPQTA